MLIGLKFGKKEPPATRVATPRRPKNLEGGLRMLLFQRAQPHRKTTPHTSISFKPEKPFPAIDPFQMLASTPAAPQTQSKSDHASALGASAARSERHCDLSRGAKRDGLVGQAKSPCLQELFRPKSTSNGNGMHTWIPGHSSRKNSRAGIKIGPSQDFA